MYPSGMDQDIKSMSFKPEYILKESNVHISVVLMHGTNTLHIEQPSYV